MPIYSLDNSSADNAETDELVHIKVLGVTRRRKAHVAVVYIYHVREAINQTRPLKEKINMET
jgi:ribosomal protein L14